MAIQPRIRSAFIGSPRTNSSRLVTTFCIPYPRSPEMQSVEIRTYAHLGGAGMWRSGTPLAPGVKMTLSEPQSCQHQHVS